MPRRSRGVAGPMQGRTTLLLLLVLGLAIVPSKNRLALAASDLQSTALAKELMQLMSAGHLESIAAKDPAAVGSFVAALAFHGEQLLVVSGQYPSPPVLEQLITSGAFGEVYAALQGSAIPETKLFVHDMGGDGLPADRGQSVDIVYEQVDHQTLFDGSGANKSKLAKMDAQYSRLLRLLIGQLQAPQATGVGAASNNR